MLIAIVCSLDSVHPQECVFNSLDLEWLGFRKFDEKDVELPSSHTKMTSTSTDAEVKLLLIS